MNAIDPPRLHLAAKAMAILVADGTLRYRDAAGALARAADPDAKIDAAFYARLERLETTMDRTISKIERRTVGVIRAAVQQPIRHRASSKTIVMLAQLANEDCGSPLGFEVVERIALDEACKSVRQTVTAA